MKALKIAIMIAVLAAITIAIAVNDAFAETRTLTTRLIITIKAPDTQSANAPKGLEDLYNIALTQNIGQRIVKVEEPINSPSGLPRHTMTERL